MNEFENQEQELVQNEEVVQEQPEAITEEAIEPSVEQQQQATAPKESFKELRTKLEREKEARERAEKERNEMQQFLKNLEAEAYRYQQQQNAPVQKQHEEETLDLNSFDDDDLVDGKALKKILKREQQERETLKKQILIQEQERTKTAVTQRLRAKYSDLDEVLTPENVRILEQTRPALAKSLTMLQDLEEMAAETYQVIKDFGIHKPQPQNSPERDAIQRNMSKPRSSQSLSPQAGSSPLSQANAFANGLTDELKAKLYQEMLEKSRGY